MKNSMIIVISSDEHKQYFFTTDHCQNHGLDESYVSVTHYLPMLVAPRTCLPDGVIKNKKDLVAIFYDDMKEIPNPDKNFQPVDDFEFNKINLEITNQMKIYTERLNNMKENREKECDLLTDEGQGCFDGTLKECEEFAATQTPDFMYKVVPMTKEEIEAHPDNKGMLIKMKNILEFIDDLGELKGSNFHENQNDNIGNPPEWLTYDIRKLANKTWHEHKDVNDRKRVMAMRIVQQAAESAGYTIGIKLSTELLNKYCL